VVVREPAPPINPGLLRAVRQRMAEQSNDELLRIWVENDRVHWSAETFEAVRSLLAERGVPLPPQGDPPPLAKKRDRLAELDPATAYWMEWLRPVLRVGVALAVVQLVAGVATVVWVGDDVMTSSLGEWLTSPLVLQAGWSAVLSCLLLVGAWSAARVRPETRGILLFYCWASLITAALRVLVSVHYALAAEYTGGYAFSYVADVAPHAVYPLVLLLLFRRQEIKDIFQPRLVAFEVKQ